MTNQDQKPADYFCLKCQGFYEEDKSLALTTCNHVNPRSDITITYTIKSIDEPMTLGPKYQEMITELERVIWEAAGTSAFYPDESAEQWKNSTKPKADKVFRGIITTSC